MGRGRGTEGQPLRQPAWRSCRHCSERCIDLLDLQSGERVLDIATGTGVAAFMAALKVGASGEVVATDISQKMVDAVREEAERQGVSNTGHRERKEYLESIAEYRRGESFDIPGEFAFMLARKP